MATTVQLSKADMEELRRSLLHDLRADERRRSKKTFGKKFTNDVSIMGLSEAITANHSLAKLIWTLVFVGCLGAAAYFVFKVLLEYLANPTATKVKMTSQRMYYFPPLVLCVDTWLNADKAHKLGLTKESIHYALSYLIATSDIYEPIFHPSNSSTAKQEFEDVFYRENFTSLFDFYKFITLDAKRADEESGKNSTADDITYTCFGCIGDQLPKMIIDHNVCYNLSLNGLDGRARQSYGWFDLIIRVPDLSMGLTRRRTYWRLYVNPLMTKFVTAAPFLSIQRGYTHTIRIASEHYRMINKPKEPCIEKDRIKGRNYSALSCSLDCIYKEVIFDHNCSIFNLDKNIKRNLSDYCNTYYMDKWATDSQGNSFKKTDKGYLDCLSACPAECSFWHYDNDIDIHVSSQLQRESIAGKHIGDKKVNVSAAKVYFVNADVLSNGILRFTEVYTYSFETLLGNIGGTCGIWIGVSIMTLVKLVAFCSKRGLTLGRRSLAWNKAIGNEVKEIRAN